MSVIVIAEAGVNHDGDVDRACRLVDAAADAGADIVKFQTFRADQIATVAAPKAAYQQRSTDPGESQREMLRRLELTPAMHERLVAQCRARGIEFLSTGFDPESIDLLVALGCAWIKVPSGELTNLPYLRHAGRQQKRILLSTGMATLEEIGAALGALEHAGTPRDRIIVLQCTTAYPAPVEDANLQAMSIISRTFGVATGYSDHTSGIDIATAAVALGAVVLEKHLTLDRSLPGPDHAASLEPREFGDMVKAVRRVEQALGDGEKRPRASEVGNRAAARRSLVAARAIKAGERFSEDNLAARRPGTGVSPMRWDEAVGCTARRDYAPDEPIDL
jgi:N,N'-diacetyllegionaminate synthase